jgi:hypothetical protein
MPSAEEKRQTEGQRTSTSTHLRALPIALLAHPDIGPHESATAPGSLSHFVVDWAASSNEIIARFAENLALCKVLGEIQMP